MPEQPPNNFGIKDEYTILARIARANKFLDGAADHENLIKANCMTTKLYIALGSGTIPCSNETFNQLRTLTVRLIDKILDAVIKMTEEGDEKNIKKAKSLAELARVLLIEESLKEIAFPQMVKFIGLARKLGYNVDAGQIEPSRTS